MTCEDGEKKTKKYVKVCQACEDMDKDAPKKTDAAEEDPEEMANYAAEFCC